MKQTIESNQTETLKQRYIEIVKRLNAELIKSPVPHYANKVYKINEERNEIYNKLLRAGCKIVHIMENDNGFITPIKVVELDGRPYSLMGYSHD